VTKRKAVRKFDDFAAIFGIVRIEGNGSAVIGNNFVAVLGTGNSENTTDGIDGVTGGMKGEREEGTLTHQSPSKHHHWHFSATD
jgi:hypothetical protein